MLLIGVLVATAVRSSRKLLGLTPAAIDAAIRKTLAVADNVFNAAIDATVKRLTGQDPEITASVESITALEFAGEPVGRTSPRPVSSPPVRSAGASRSASVSVRDIAATWSSTVTSGFLATVAQCLGATIVGSSGKMIGTDPLRCVAIGPRTHWRSRGPTSTASTARAVSRSTARPRRSLGVSGDWNNYSATVTGNVSITLTTGGRSHPQRPAPPRRDVHDHDHFGHIDRQRRDLVAELRRLSRHHRAAAARSTSVREPAASPSAASRSTRRTRRP